MSEKFDFFSEIPIFSKILKVFDYSQIFGNISILIKFPKISIFSKKFEKFRLSQIFEIFDFVENLRTIPIFPKISKNVDSGQNFRKISKILILVEIKQISKNFDFGEIFEKFLL